MLVFKTTDKGSGVKGYKINLGNSKWIDADSPYPILKRILPYTIIVRAIDFNDNYQDSIVHIPGILSIKVVIIIFIFLAGFCTIVFKMIKYKREKYT